MLEKERFSDLHENHGRATTVASGTVPRIRHKDVLEHGNSRLWNMSPGVGGTPGRVREPRSSPVYARPSIELDGRAAGRRRGGLANGIPPLSLWLRPRAGFGASDRGGRKGRRPPLTKIPPPGGAVKGDPIRFFVSFFGTRRRQYSLPPPKGEATELVQRQQVPPDMGSHTGFGSFIGFPMHYGGKPPMEGPALRFRSAHGGSDPDRPEAHAGLPNPIRPLGYQSDG